MNSDTEKLFHAIDLNNTRYINEVLIKNKGNINKFINSSVRLIQKMGMEWYFDPFFYAIYTKKDQIVNLFLKYNIDVNTVDEHGNSPLIYAARNDNNGVEIFKKLLDSGADINLINKGGLSVLSMTSLFGSKEMLKILIDRGVKINDKNKDGDNVLMNMSDHPFKEMSYNNWFDKNYLIDRINILIESGVKLDSKNNKGKTCLDIAWDNKYYNLVENYLKNGMELNSSFRYKILNDINLNSKVINKDGKSLLKYVKQLNIKTHIKNNLDKPKKDIALNHKKNKKNRI